MRVASDRFVITPTAMDYRRMDPGDLCTVDLKTATAVAGPHRPSIESGLHAAIYRERPDAVAVIHTHQPFASAVALLGVELAVEEPGERELLGRRVLMVPYAPSGTVMLVRALRKRLRTGANAFVLRNHGIICFGPSIAVAIAAVQGLEDLARRYLRSAIEIAGNAPTRLEALEMLK